MRYKGLIIGLAVAVSILTGYKIFRYGERFAGVLENIKSIPFYQDDFGFLVTEKLAHADVYLREPVLAKKMRISFKFIPMDMSELALGIRENPFWLSYEPIVFYQVSQGNHPNNKIQEAVIEIPLSDKIQDSDQSIDLMFFGHFPGEGSGEYEGERDLTKWVLQDMRITTFLTRPSRGELKDYFRSLITEERPL